MDSACRQVAQFSTWLVKLTRHTSFWNYFKPVKWNVWTRYCLLECFTLICDTCTVYTIWSLKIIDVAVYATGLGLLQLHIYANAQRDCVKCLINYLTRSKCMYSLIVLCATKTVVRNSKCNWTIVSSARSSYLILKKKNKKTKQLQLTPPPSFSLSLSL